MSDAPEREPLLVHRREGWRELALNRPEKRNSLSQELLSALADELRAADEDPDTHAVMISGGGESPDFCTGYFYDGTPASSLEEDISMMERDQRRIQTIFDMHKPVIAKVHGRCFAGGTDLALMCDMVIAEESALFAFPPHRDFGHGPNEQWIYHCGPQWAKRLLFTGDTIDAVDAARIGLILKAVPAAALDRETEGLMRRLSRIDPALLAVHKRAINLSLELMGARTFQRLALELDARSHLAPHAMMVKERSLGPDAEDFNRALKAERLDKFGRGRLRVGEPDPYDDEGRLT